MLIKANTTRAVGHNKQQTSNNREQLKEVILDKVAQRRVGRQIPEIVDEKIAQEQDQDQHKRWQLGLEPHRNHDDQNETDSEEDDVRGVVKRKDSEEHEDEQHTAGQLHVSTWLVAANCRHASKHGLPFIASFRQQKQKSTR